MAAAEADPGMEITAEESEPEKEETVTVETIYRVSNGKHKWFPTTYHIEKHGVFVSLAKGDPGLCLVVTGRGLNRHAKRPGNDLKREWWHEVRQLRCLARSVVFCWPALLEVFVVLSLLVSDQK